MSNITLQIPDATIQKQEGLPEGISRLIVPDGDLNYEFYIRDEWAEPHVSGA